MSLQSSERVECGIILSEGWPTWVQVVYERDWFLSLVTIKGNNRLQGVINRFYPGAVIIPYDQVEVQTLANINITCWLSDVDPPRSLNIFGWAQCSVVISCRKARHTPAGWSRDTLKLVDAECGCSTTGEWYFYIYWLEGASKVKVLDTIPGRDMTCFFNSRVQGLPCEAPRIKASCQPRLAQIRSNVYSAGGLYPLHSCNPYLVTHCHLSPTGWARCHLTGMELCQIKGIPENMASRLPSNVVRDVCQDAAMFTAWTGHQLLDIMNIEGGREELDKRKG